MAFCRCLAQKRQAPRVRRRGRLRKGVASCFLAERATADLEIPVFVQAPAHPFRPPPSDDAPMIMIGPGTGIAPFRAFLQERRENGAKGPNWLFFGDQLGRPTSSTRMN